MILDLAKYRRTKLEPAEGEVFTHRLIKGVNPEDIFTTVSSIINPYGLPSVTLSIEKHDSKANVLIEPSDSFMHCDYLYDHSRFTEMFNNIQSNSIVVEMKFDGTFYQLDGAIDGMSGHKFITLGE